MDTGSLKQYEDFLVQFLDSVSEKSLWGWDARPNGSFLVVQEEDQEAAQSFLKGHFESSWEEDNVINAPKNIQHVIEHLQGIRPRQHLYTKNLADNLVMYAAYWPWAAAKRVSVRISLFPNNDGQLSREDTEKLVAAALSANERHEKALSPEA